LTTERMFYILSLCPVRRPASLSQPSAPWYPPRFSLIPLPAASRPVGSFDCRNSPRNRPKTHQSTGFSNRARHSAIHHMQARGLPCPCQQGCLAGPRLRGSRLFPSRIQLFLIVFLLRADDSHVSLAVSSRLRWPPSVNTWSRRLVAGVASALLRLPRQLLRVSHAGPLPRVI
jgi:hypothetical protein